ncbi:bifunctional hydroxymethylpyrimidine kinase/phosphomethylpyrimidine kinase [Lactobacillaceae bacterium Melli_B4]
MQQFPEALTIAGIDSDGGGGMPIDLKTMMALKVYGLSAITTVVAANSYGINDSQMLSIPFIQNEIKTLTDDYDIKATKTGMLDNRALIELVVNSYHDYKLGPLVVDPVILAKTGEVLLKPDAIEALKNELIPLATVITPNYYEAALLTGVEINDANDMVTAAHALMKLGSDNVMIKGRHDMNGQSQSKVSDLVMLANGKTFWLTGPYFKTKRKNGTGDALSAAITAELANGHNVETAIKAAKQYVDLAIEHSIMVGHEYGPINNWIGKEND